MCLPPTGDGAGNIHYAPESVLHSVPKMGSAAEVVIFGAPGPRTECDTFICSREKRSIGCWRCGRLTLRSAATHASVQAVGVAALVGFSSFQ